MVKPGFLMKWLIYHSVCMEKNEKSSQDYYQIPTQTLYNENKAWNIRDNRQDVDGLSKMT